MRTSTLVRNLNRTVLQASPEEKDTDACWPFAWPPGQDGDAAVNKAEVSRREIWGVIWAGKGVEIKVQKGYNKTKTHTRLQSL